MKRKLPKVDCRRGAPMGRHNTTTCPELEARFNLVLMPLDSGGYDSSGVYWGLGDQMWWSYAKNTDQEMFVRAVNREDARRQVLAIFKNAKFYR